MGTAAGSATGGYWLVASDGGVFAYKTLWAFSPQVVAVRHDAGTFSPQIRIVPVLLVG